MKQNNSTIYGLMVLAAFAWSGAFIAGKFALPYIPVFTLTFFRFLIALLVLFPVMWVFQRAGLEKHYSLRKKDVPVFLFTGIVGMFGYHTLFFTALKYTTAINSSMLGACNPIVTTLITIVFLRYRPPKLQILGIVISFIGVILTISAMDPEVIRTLQFNKGDIIMFVAVMCWAAYSVFSKAKGADIPPVALTYYSFLFCLIALIPFVLWEKPWTLEQLPASAVLAVIFMAVFSSVLGYVIQQMAIKKIGAARSSIFINLVPVFSMVLSVVILHEELLPVKILTAIMIIAGVCICQLAGEKKSREEGGLCHEK